jgi:preprotein translocase subunit SecD/SecD/SecF fusion protein
MTDIRDVLATADPVRYERRPTEAERDRLRHTIVAAAPQSDAQSQRTRRPILVPVLVTLAMIGLTAAASSMWPRSGSLAQAAIRFEVRLAEDQPAPGLRAARVGSSNRTVYVHPEVVVTNDDIERSSVIAGDTPSHFWIDVRLNAGGAEKMRRATAGHLGKPVAILIDDDVVTSPTLKSPIGAAAVISGDYTQADAQRIAGGMRGSAP